MWLFIIGIILLVISGSLFWIAVDKEELYIGLNAVLAVICGLLFAWPGPHGHDRSPERLEETVSYRVLATAQSGTNDYTVLEETDGTVMFFRLLPKEQQPDLVVGKLYHAGGDHVLVPLKSE